MRLLMMTLESSSHFAYEEDMDAEAEHHHHEHEEEHENSLHNEVGGGETGLKVPYVA